MIKFKSVFLKTLRYQTAFACILLFSCTSFSGGKAPIWTYDIESVYPESNFLTAIGSGTDKIEAKNDALASLSKYIVTKISTLSTSEISLSGNGNDFHTKKHSKTAASVSSNAVLFGLKYTEPYFDAKSNSWTAAAIINKQETWKKIQTELSAAEQKLTAFYTQAKQEEDGFSCFLALKKAEKAAYIFSDMFLFASAVNSNAALMYNNAQTIIAGIPAEISSLAGKLPIYISITNDSGSRFRSQIGKILSSLGFSVTDNEKKAKLSLTGIISLEQKNLDLIVIYPSIELTIKNNDRCLYSFSCNIKKAAGYTQNSAENKALLEIEKEIEKSFLNL